jgi:crotonobetainyl-CoA:carnitine CoA-transferase CaiB-like acyl-CoA transferase
MSYDLLDGIRVVEVSMYAFAPSCAAVLADWGADVVKVLPTDVDDPMRGNPVAGLPAVDVGVAFMYEQMNRGKRCIAIDLANPAGQAVLHEVVATADVFVTNLLPSARQRFRIDVDHIEAVRPGIVYARASGHGAKGPEAETGGFDPTDFWARTGIAHAASTVSDEFVPQAGPALGDLTSGGFLAGGIAAALLRRERTGRGAVVDVSLLSSGIWAFAPGVVASRLYDIDGIPRRRHKDQPNPLVGAYRTADAREIYLAGVQTDGRFENFCTVIGRRDLLDDPRFATGEDRLAHARVLIDVFDETFARHDLSHWLEVLPDLQTPWSIVQTAREAADDVQVAANGYLAPVEGGPVEFSLAASPVQFDEVPLALTPGPGHGEHTEQVLLDLGKTWDEILELKVAGAIL